MSASPRLTFYQRNVTRVQRYRGGAFRCNYCGVRLLDPVAHPNHADSATIDHIVPRCNGGDDNLINLALACRRCNEDKGNKSMMQWARQRVAEGLSVPRFPKMKPHS